VPSQTIVDRLDRLQMFHILPDVDTILLIHMNVLSVDFCALSLLDRVNGHHSVVELDFLVNDYWHTCRVQVWKWRSIRLHRCFWRWEPLGLSLLASFEMGCWLRHVVCFLRTDSGVAVYLGALPLSSEWVSYIHMRRPVLKVVNFLKWVLPILSCCHRTD